jgi:hypothetical protein
MGRQADIVLEKHSLNKIKEAFGPKELPCVNLVGTFKDQFNLYFLTEIFAQKCELWEHCRSFGMIDTQLA